MPFKKILIANRGEIACRVIRTAQRLGVKTVAVYSEADRLSQHVQMADEAFCLGPAPAAESYLLTDTVLEVAERAGAEAVHPGYGFLSENADFANACAARGVTFIGPPAQAILDMGCKSASKNIMTDAGVPCTPGYHGEDQEMNTFVGEAEKIGYPVMVKAIKGGGGKGMRIVDTPDQLEEGVEACRREAIKSFADSGILLERYLRKPRHVELQVFADTQGNAVHLFERDCSVQRRHQKVLEEAPAPGMSTALREKMGNAAVAAARAVNYVGAGTVEFMLDEDEESFFFMEMNTRLQVEHPVSEMITGLDLVEWQLRVAAGEPLPIPTQSEIDSRVRGHALEARIYAENPDNNFLPGSGPVAGLSLPEGASSFSPYAEVRVDSGVVAGDNVSIFYDPMIAKLVVHSENRSDALAVMDRALSEFRVAGLPTNIDFLRRCVQHPEFQEGKVDTSFIEKNMDELLPPVEEGAKPLPDAVLALAAIYAVLDEATGTEINQLVAASGGGGSSDPHSPWSASSLAGRRVTEPLTRNMCFRCAATDGGGEGHAVSAKVTYQDASKGIFHVHMGEEDQATALYVEAELQDGGISAVLRPLGDGKEHDGGRGGHRVYAAVSTHSDVLSIFPEDSVMPLSSSSSSGRLRHRYDLMAPETRLSGADSGSGGDAVLTPMPGTIVRTNVEAGERVEKGQPLMILEAMKMEHVIKADRDAVIKSVNFGAGEFAGDGSWLVEFETEE